MKRRGAVRTACIIIMVVMLFSFVLAGTCGNSIVEDVEDCDDGNTASGDGCSSSCVMETGYSCFLDGLCISHCGDGILASGEVCDDGNRFDYDGCSATCQIESGFVCNMSAGVTACNDGHDNDGDGLTDFFDPSCLQSNDFSENGTLLFVATNGDDTNPGTIDAPVQTLSRAKSLARSIISEGLTEDLFIVIRGGRYALSSTFDLGSEDSGNNGYRVVWRLSLIHI